MFDHMKIVPVTVLANLSPLVWLPSSPMLNSDLLPYSVHLPRSTPRKSQISLQHPSRAPPTRIMVLIRIILAIQHHNSRALSINTIPVQIPRAPRNPRLIGDAIRAADRFIAIIARVDFAVEEGPECGTVEVDARSAVDVLRKAHPAGLVTSCTPREIRVAKGGVCGPGAWGILLGSGTLPVCGFGLLQASVDILGVVQVVVVESIVLEAGAGEPSGFGSLD